MENANTQNLLQLHVQAAVQLANLCNMGSYPAFPSNAVWQFPADQSSFKGKRAHFQLKRKGLLTRSGVQGLDGSVALVESSEIGSPKHGGQHQLLTALTPLHNLRVKSPLHKSEYVKQR